MEYIDPSEPEETVQEWLERVTLDHKLRDMAARDRDRMLAGEGLDYADYHEGAVITEEGLEIPS